MSYKYLFKPISLGSLEIRNRIVMLPMAMNDAHPPGFPSEQTQAFFASRARGGVGLIVVGGTYATRLGWETSGMHNFRIDVESTLPSFARLVQRVHAFGARIFVQLMQCAGRQGTSRVSGVQPVSCTAEAFASSEETWPEGLKFPGGLSGEVPRELSIEEIIELEDEVANSALMAKAAGFDGVEIPCHHGYLSLSFLSPRINKRRDLYGGNLENRMRFIFNSVVKVREKVGPDFALGVRLCSSEHIEGGLSCKESVEVARLLEKELDFFSLADGVYETAKFVFPEKDGTLLEHGEPQAFKKVLKIPLITPSIHDPNMAEAAIRDEKTDMVGLGRQLIADEEWANKMMKGRANEIRKCDRDNACLVNFFFGLPVRCAINPNSGREQYMQEYYPPPFEVEGH
jgi:2,4-dienoyl-CoA reductase-like NADH-dependent reductase (Old Yellow Enzyme family)